MRTWGLLVLLAASTAHAERYAYVVNNGDNTVTAIDVDAGTVAAIIALPGHGLRGVAVHPDGRSVYVTAVGPSSVNGEDKLYVIDVPQHTLGATVTLPHTYPYGVAVDPAGDYVYTSHLYAQFVNKIPTLTLDETQIRSLDIGGSGGSYLTVDPAGDRIYVVTDNPTTGGGDLLWTDPDGTSPGGRTGVASFPGGIASYGFGGHIVLLTRASASGRQLVSVDTDSPNGLILTLTSTGAPTGVASRTSFGFPIIYTTQRDNDLISQVFSFDQWATEGGPVALAYSDDEVDTSDRDALISANFDAGSATLAYADGSIVNVPVGSQPVAVAAAAVLRPRFEFSPATVRFSWTVLNELRFVMVKLRNAGAGSLVFERFLIEGTDYRALSIGKNKCPTRLAPGAACEIEVQFKAIPKDGKYPSYAATLSIASNDPAGARTIPLSAVYGK